MLSYMIAHEHPGAPIFVIEDFEENDFFKEMFRFGVQMYSRGLLPNSANKFIIEQRHKPIPGRKLGSLVNICVIADDHVTISAISLFGDGRRADWGGMDIYQDRTVCRPTQRWHILANSQGYNDSQRHFIVTMCSPVTTLQGMLLSRDVVSTVVPARPKLNKHRVRAGKPPTVEYKVLTINPRSVIEHSPSSDGAGRQSPRLHFRRGHFRRLANKITAVAPAIIGAADRGVIIKDYRANIVPVARVAEDQQ